MNNRKPKKENGILLFGGTFDPIHNGHLIIARAAAEKLQVQEVIVIPSANPPHKDKKSITAAEHRLVMVHLAVRGDELFDVSDCELLRPGPSYTLDTVRFFRELCGPQAVLYWLIGADSISDLVGWYKVGQLVDECTVVTARRPGCDWGDLSVLQTVLNDEQIARLKDNAMDTPQVDISATEIRRRVNAGLSIGDLVPPEVCAYIAHHGLYKLS